MCGLKGTQHNVTTLGDAVHNVQPQPVVDNPPRGDVEVLDQRGHVPPTQNDEAGNDQVEEDMGGVEGPPNDDAEYRRFSFLIDHTLRLGLERRLTGCRTDRPGPLRVATVNRFFERWWGLLPPTQKTFSNRFLLALIQRRLGR